MTKDDSSNTGPTAGGIAGILGAGIAFILSTVIYVEYRDSKIRSNYNSILERALKKADLNKDGVLQPDERRKWYSDMGIDRVIDGTEQMPLIEQLEDYIKKED